MIITDLLLVISSVTVIDTTQLPDKGKLLDIAISKKDSASKNTQPPSVPVKKKAEPKEIFNKVRRGGWDGN